MRLFGWRGLLGLAVVTTAMVFGVGTASAAFHGIGLTKGCVSPVKIGDPYACSVQILNVVDQGHDTVRVTSLGDQVNSAGGPVNSGNILPSIGLVFSGAVTCTGGSGAGTSASPYVGATSCLLVFGSSITTTGFTHYTVQPADFNLPNHRLTDAAGIGWNNTCQFNPDNDCTTLPQAAGAGSSALIVKLNTTTATDIHNATHQTVTTVEARSTVHDFVSVTGQPNRPIPSGNVNIDWFLNGDCSGAPATNSGSIGPLNASGQLDATGFAFTVNTPGFRAFKAHYEGDSVYLPSDGPCEPLRVVDANVQITPDGVNRVGATHVFTGHVNVNDGTGFTNAPAGTIISFFKHSGPGGFVGNDYCLTIGGTGSCTVSILSNTTGVNVVSAHTIVAAGGLSLTRHTDAVNGNSDVATKRWVNAKIAITPDATNRVGAPHTFTVTLMKDAGDGNGFIAAAGEHVDVNLIDSLGAVHTAPTGTCTAAGANTNASGQCTITFASNSTGKVTGHASSTLSVAGSAAFTVQTNGVAPNSGDAVKTYVNAKIAIAPDATNEVGAPHTFTVTLMKDTGNGAGFVAAAGEHVDFTLTDSNGAVHSAPTGTCTAAGANTNASGQCTITFTSNSAGKVTAHASSVVSIGGAAAFTVATDGQAPNSGDAVKTFVDANIQITPNGVNRVGDSHVFTAHVNINAGDGNGFVNAPAGTQISFTKDSGPGSFTTTNPCTVVVAGSCQVTLSSATTGVTIVSAHSTLSVGGVSLTRHTNGTGANSGPATKTWVDAKIAIAPDQTNEVGQPHTFTVTLQKDIGNGAGFVAAAGEHVNFTLTNSNGASFTLNAASSTCDDAGANTNASGQCTIVINSSTAGKVTAHASSTLSVAGSAPFTVQTNGVAPNSGDAVKTYVDANILITPDGVNRVGESHTFTAHVNINAGDGNGFVNAPAGTQISFTKDSGPGGFTTANPCTVVVAGSCQITLSSAVTGVTIVSAHTTVTVGGVPLTRHTNGTGANSGPATKRWVDAKIAIAPDQTNEIGQPHTFTVTLMKDTGTGTFVAAAGEHVSFTLTNSNGASFTLNAASSTCDDAGANTNASGQCTIVINSSTAGKVTAHASSTLSVAGSAPFTVQTDGVLPNSGDAVKTYVDANIQITPAEATNPTGTNHTLFGHVNVNTGTGGYVNAPAGTTINFSILSGPGSFVGGVNSCNTVAATGTCSVQITSATGGTTTIRATTDVTVGGVSLHRATGDSHVGDGPDAIKHWAAAKISIAPNQTNEIGVPHTFTVTLQKDVGAGFVAAAGEHVSFTLTNSNGASFTLNAASSTCDDAGANTNASGQCTIVINSNLAGKVTAHAAATIDFGGGTSIHVETDGVAPNSGDAVKTYVDANIQITPQTDNNPVSTNHTLTGHVNVNDGQGGGYANAPNGTQITFSLQNSGGATASFVGNNFCLTTGATGSCTVVISSSTTGTTTINATTTVSVGGVSLTRTTGDGKVGDSADANKLWADATARTDIHDSAHNVVISGVPGLVVHDKVFVERTAGTPAAVPNPTGTVVFHRYTTIDCTGSPTDETVALAANGTAETSTFTAVGNMSYQAHYNGDANYPARDGACEPLSVSLPCPAGLFLAGTGAGGGAGDLNIAYDQFPAPNDNSYGVNAVGWPSGHTFGNLTGSDKAGFQIVNPAGTIVLSFNIDSISSTAVSAAAPSGYASLGPFGGDGGIVVNPAGANALTNDPAKITWDTAIARNLNKTAYFAGGVQVKGKPATAGCDAASAGAGTCFDLLVNSPKTVNTTDNYTLVTPNPWTAVYANPEYAAMNLTPVQQAQVVSTVNGWNFHNTFFVTLKQAYLTALGFDFNNWTFGPSAVAGKWTVMPNINVLHNSPAKPCPPAPPTPASLSVTNKTVSGKVVSITIQNSGGADAILNQLALSWPQAPNGNLATIKLDGDTVYSNTTGVASPQTMGVPPLTATVSKRTIEGNGTEVLTLTFKNNVDTNLTHYTGTASFDSPVPNLTLLP